MSKKQKKQPASTPAAQRPPGGIVVPRSVVSVEETEPVAERRPVPVFLIVLLVVLVYLGDMYVMDHGADVMGKTGPFPKLVFDPDTSYDQIVLKNPVDPRELAIRDGRAVFNLTCAACHQSTGQGLPGQFPPLAGSEWVNTEGANRIVRALMTGLGGPITVLHNQFNNSMPPWKDTLTDEQIAHVLTFIRSEWGNKAPPVTPDQVKKVRDQVGSRSEPSSEDELKKLPEAIE
jgi:mono/diheme cytochrome c family protein